MGHFWKDLVLQLWGVMYNTSTMGLVVRLHRIIFPIIFTGSYGRGHRRASGDGHQKAEPSSWKTRRASGHAVHNPATFWQLAEIFVDKNLGVWQGFNDFTFPFSFLSFQMLPQGKRVWSLTCSWHTPGCAPSCPSSDLVPSHSRDGKGGNRHKYRDDARII